MTTFYVGVGLCWLLLSALALVQASRHMGRAHRLNAVGRDDDAVWPFLAGLVLTVIALVAAANGLVVVVEHLAAAARAG